MQFEVNERNYFLHFVAEEGRWFLFTPTQRGMERIAIADDTALPIVGDVIIPFEYDGQSNMN